MVKIFFHFIELSKHLFRHILVNNGDFKEAYARKLP